jgi:hypothetical protein
VAIYTTFFLCEPSVLREGFPDWKPALAEPVRRELRNPFTGELTVIESRQPEWPDGEQDVSVPEYQAVTIDVPYEEYLEARLPAFVRQFPHWAAKGLTCVELNPLLQILGISDELDMPIYSPPSRGDVLEEFPQEFTALLATADVASVARQWAAEMSTPTYTHSVSGNRVNDDWTLEEAQSILTPIAALARDSIPSQRLYLLSEC